jgi:pimeloyl-ACP methyl ester carboxylesterase
LHGQTMNGAEMRRQLEPVEQALPNVTLVAPDAPHRCPDETVDRLYSFWNAPRHAPPHLMWWDASEDGRAYRGWEATRDQMRSLLEDGPVGIIGLSQGAILAAALATMAGHAEMPPIEFVILVAGRPPRADVLQPFLERPIAVRSLHVWGDDDPLAQGTPAVLVERFAPATREILTWSGGHSVPTTREGIDAIVDFIRPSAMMAR